LRDFGIEGDHFVLDGKPFQIISGEMHYSDGAGERLPEVPHIPEPIDVAEFRLNEIAPLFGPSRKAATPT